MVDLWELLQASEWDLSARAFLAVSGDNPHLPTPLFSMQQTEGPFKTQTESWGFPHSASLDGQATSPSPASPWPLSASSHTVVCFFPLPASCLLSTPSGALPWPSLGHPKGPK